MREKIEERREKRGAGEERERETMRVCFCVFV
jgi:hypothetical protein